MTSPVVGIDLGTTNTVVGVVRDGQAVAIADAEGHRLLPSVVSFHPNGNVLVGREAKARRRIDAPNTVYSVKRLIGRAWSSDEVKAARKRFAFDMKEGPGNAALVVARGETYTLPEISAFVLRKAKQMAEQALAQPVERAVITVPANFNDLQRAATKVAGRVAGLEVLRILNEPTAAALAYGFGRGHNERIAVYDFGGGTLDITLLDLSGNVFEVLATAGNTFLGGDDIDLAMAGRMADECLKLHRFDPRSNRESFEQLRSAAEVLKIQLSSERAATIDIPEFVPAPGGKLLTFPFSMTREEFETLATPIIDQTFAVCQEALKIAGLEPTHFDQVMLVGGSTRIPLVRDRVRSFFGRTPMSHLNPDEVVAIGAAIQANALAAGQRRHSVVPAPPGRLRRETAPPPFPGAPNPPRPHIATHPGIGEGSEVPRALRRARQDTLQPPDAVPPAPLGVEPYAQSTDLPLVLPSQEPLPGRALRGPGTDELEELDESDLVDLDSDEDSKTPEPRALKPEALESMVASHREGPREIPLLGVLPAPLGHDPDDFEETPPTDPVPGVAPPPGFGLASPNSVPPSIRSTRPLAPVSVGVASIPSPSISVRDGRSHGAPVVQSVRGDVIAGQGAPLLVDVTPLSLSVETVRGFCDAIVARNTPVPCERTRVFATAADNQQAVRVRISQGESSRFDDNTLLGELELSGLRPAPRGRVQIEVTFVLDTDGILNVHARDLQTGRATSVRVRLEGLPEIDAVEDLARRHMKHPTL